MRRTPTCYISECGTFAYSHDSKGNVIYVDIEDKHYLENHVWSCTSKGYIYRMVGRQAIYLHKEIMGRPGKQQVDHEDRDKADNRKHNLRAATNGQNQANQGRTSNSTIYKGVYQYPGKGRCYAQISVNGKKTRLGTFDSPREAAIAYDEAALAAFGEFAVLNFPSTF